MSYTEMHKREKEGGRGTSSLNSLKLYRPLPNKPEPQPYRNEVFFSLFKMSKWRMFRPLPQDVERYGLVVPGASGVVSVLEEDESFYFRLPVHDVKEFQRPDGTVGFSYVLCPVKVNKYLIGLNYQPLFDKPRCAHCEREQEWWNTHNARWQALGFDSEAKKALETSRYRQIIEGDDTLKRTRTVARSYGTSDKYIYSVFDHAKMVGTRQWDEGQKNLEYQLWIGAKSAWAALSTIYDIREEAVSQGRASHFFQTTDPAGLNIMCLIKDTTECVGRDMMRTKYSVVEGSKYPYGADWLAYLNNEDARVDPSEFIFLPNYSDMQELLRESMQSNTNPASAQVPAQSQPLPSGTQPQPPQGAMPPHTAAGHPLASMTPPSQTQPPAAQPQAAPQPAPQAPDPTPNVPPSQPSVPSVPSPPVPPQAPPQQTPQPAATPAPQPAQPAQPAATPAPAPQAAPPVPSIPAMANPGQATPPAATPPAATPPSPGVPPAATPPAGDVPDRTPPAGEPPPGRRQKW